MQWSETTASQCRYGEIASELFDGWDIILDRSIADYQGDVNIIAHKDGKICFFQYSYGSCGGCDAWEGDGLTDGQILEEMKSLMVVFDSKEQFFEFVKERINNPTLFKFETRDIKEALSKI